MKILNTLRIKYVLLWIGIVITLLGISTAYIHTSRACYSLDHAPSDSTEISPAVYRLRTAIQFARYSNYISAFGLLLIVTGATLKNRQTPNE